LGVWEVCENNRIKASVIRASSLFITCTCNSYSIRSFSDLLYDRLTSSVTLILCVVRFIQCKSHGVGAVIAHILKVANLLRLAPNVTNYERMLPSFLQSQRGRVSFLEARIKIILDKPRLWADCAKVSH